MTGPALGHLADAVVRTYRDRTPGSEALFERGRKVLPGGVSGNLRFFHPYPLYMASGDGAFMTDVDGNRYLDCFLCNGPLLLGHRPPAVHDAIAQTAAMGSLTLNPAPLIDCAEQVCAAVPSAERVRFLNSGSEALTAAIRISRGYTGRAKVIKFFGHYHGQDDQVLVGAGPGRTPFSSGIPEDSYANTLTLPFNNIAAVSDAIAGGEIAVVLVDCAMHSGGLWGTSHAYLEELRALTSRAGVLLLFDEVITGFRMSTGGAQQHYEVTPDLTTLAKALGAGERISAVAGRADVLSVLDPLATDAPAKVFQSGTGNDGLAGLAAATAAVKRYRELGASGEYAALGCRAERLARGLKEAFAQAGIPCHVNQQASMLQLFLSADEPEFERFSRVDQQVLDLFFLAMIAHGVVLTLPTSNHVYLSFAHGDAEIDLALETARHVLRHYPFDAAFADAA